VRGAVVIDFDYFPASQCVSTVLGRHEKVQGGVEKRHAVLQVGHGMRRNFDQPTLA
jgi:hypothetical protein